MSVYSSVTCSFRKLSLGFPSCPPPNRARAGTSRFQSKIRLAAKELAGVFNFSHKAFVKLLSCSGAGTPSSPAGLEATDTGDKDGATKSAAAAATGGGGKKAKKKRKAAEMMAAAAAAAAAVGRRGEGRGADDTRHLGVDLLCAFMDSGTLVLGFPQTGPAACMSSQILAVLHPPSSVVFQR